MIKVNYEFIAQQPIHTGSDENTGTERKLRREKVLLQNPVTFTSKFTSLELKREAILAILYHVYKSIDFEGMQKSRLMGIWDEFTSKVLASAAVRTKEQFLNTICNKLGIRSLANDFSDNIAFFLEQFNDTEFLELIRNELQYLILLLRLKIKEQKEVKKLSVNMFETPGPNSASESDMKSIPEFTKFFDYIPYISGNSIRGYLRRIVMYDFTKKVGVSKIDKNLYHQLFTGGNITDSTGKESLENREKFINMCPMIGLLGSAIGNQTIEGELKVGGARPQCLEHGTGQLSFWELIQTKFQTRLDSSKTEKDIEIVSNSKEAPTSQMIYQYETFVIGTKFNSSFAIVSDNELLISAFYHLLTLFKENNYICGNSARDSGLIDLSDLKIPEGANQLYLDHLETNKEEIFKYFQSSKVDSTLFGVR